MMARPVACWVLCAAAFTWASLGVAQEKGTLERIGDETREEGEDREPDDSDTSDGSGGFLADIASPFVRLLVLMPYWGPAAAAGDANGLDAQFPAHPYADDLDGYLRFDGESSGTDPWALRLAVENGNDFDGINRANANFLLSTQWRVGLQGQVNYYTERLQGRGSDELYLGDLNVIVRFAQHETFQFRSGLGFNILGDDEGTELGFNFTYGADFFPAEHLVLSLSVDAGTLGSAAVVHPRATVGFILGDWELYAGWDHRWVGSTDVYGPMVGLRFWY